MLWGRRIPLAVALCTLNATILLLDNRVAIAAPPIQMKRTSTQAEKRDKRMTTEEFWQCIGHINQKVLKAGEGHDHDAVQPLTDFLATLPASKIEGFDEQLSQLLYEIDTREHMRNAGMSAGSSDGFLYARCFVVASGKTFYESVKQDPKRMPKSLDEWCEPLLYVAEQAWERSARSHKWNYSPSVSYESGSNSKGWRK
jgi:hypothetical protein